MEAKWYDGYGKFPIQTPGWKGRGRRERDWRKCDQEMITINVLI